MTRQELRKAWIDALRSGRYSQTKQALFDGRGYCCLGVLCDVAGLKPVTTNVGFSFKFDSEADYLSRGR